MCGVCFLLKQRLRRQHLLELLARQKENTENAHDIKNGDNSVNVNSAEEKKDINQNSSRHDNCSNTTHNTNNHVHAKYSSCDSMPSGSHCDVFHIELCNSTEDMHITSLANSECNKRILLQESTSCPAKLLDYTCTTMGTEHVCEVNQHALCNSDGHHHHGKEEVQCEMNERSYSSSSSLFERLVCNVLHRGPDVQKVLKRCVECRGTINMNCITTTTNNNNDNANNEKDDSNEPMYLLTNNTVETLHHGIPSNDHNYKQHDDSSVAASVATTSIGVNNTNGMAEQYDCQNYSVGGVFVHTEMQAVSSVLGLRGTVPITQPYEVEETSDRRSLQTRQCSRHNISSPVGSRPFYTSTTTNNTSAAAAITSSSSPHHTHSCGSHGKTKPEDVKSDSVLLQEQWFDEPYELYEKEIGHGAIRSSSHKSFLMWNGEIFDGAMCPPPWGSDTVILARQLCDLESKCVHLYGEEEEEQKQEHHYSSTSSLHKANKINSNHHNSGTGIKEEGDKKEHNDKGLTSKNDNTVKGDANKTNNNGDDNTWFFHFKNDTDNLMFNDFNSDEDNDNNSEGNGEAGYYYNHSTHYGNKYARHLLPLRTRQEKFLSSCVELLENNVEGPYGFVFYAARLHMAVFGRDPLGRHSLLVHASTSLSQESLELSSSSSSSSRGKGNNIIKNCNKSNAENLPTSEPGEDERSTTNKQEEEEDDDDDDYIDVEFIVSSVGVQHALRSNAESSVFVDGAANKNENNDNNNCNANVDYVHEPVSLPSHLGSNSEVNTKMISGNKRVRSNEMCEEHLHSTCATTSVANSLKSKRANNKCKKDYCNDHDEDDEDYNVNNNITACGANGVESGSKHVSDHGNHTVCWVELPVSGIFALPVQEPLITSLLSTVTKNEKEDNDQEKTKTNSENKNKPLS